MAKKLSPLPSLLWEIFNNGSWTKLARHNGAPFAPSSKAIQIGCLYGRNSKIGFSMLAPLVPEIPRHFSVRNASIVRSAVQQLRN